MFEFKSKVRKEWEKTIHSEGGFCPVCDRWGKVYKRKLNVTMVRSLIWLTKESKGAWVDVPNKAPRSVVSSNQLSSLKWWGLIERQEPEPNSKKKFSGFWKPTQLGLDFVANNVLVPLAVYTYNDQVEAFSNERVSIVECFKEHFDYKDIMKN